MSQMLIFAAARPSLPVDKFDDNTMTVAAVKAAIQDREGIPPN